MFCYLGQKNYLHIKLKGHENCPSALLVHQRWNKFNCIIRRKVHETETRGNAYLYNCRIYNTS